ncbi:hypothetical protein ACWEO1_18535 [Kitasatospora cineracea]
MRATSAEILRRALVYGYLFCAFGLWIVFAVTATKWIDEIGTTEPPTRPAYNSTAQVP